jgi:Integrase core domain
MLRGRCSVCPDVKYTGDDAGGVLRRAYAGLDSMANSGCPSNFWLKRERVKRRIYPTRDHARADVFDYIEMFYNPVRRHGNNQGLSPVEFEKQSLRHGS